MSIWVAKLDSNQHQSIFKIDALPFGRFAESTQQFSRSMMKLNEDGPRVKLISPIFRGWAHFSLFLGRAE